ncbi:hypothetical protein ACFE04_030441 [Oxalis oulophora]
MAQTPLCGKLSFEMEVKVSADKYHEQFVLPYLTAKSCPKVINKVDLLEGQWGEQGSVILWDFVSDCKPATAKQIVEVIDPKNKRVVYNVIGGSAVEGWKSFKNIVDVTPKGEGRCSVCWTLEYEKISESTPDPTTIIGALNEVNKGIEAYFN